MIDPTSVRLALAVVVVLAAIHTLLVLRRTSGAPVVLWWAGALGAYGASTVLYLGNGTALQWLTVPAANTAGVLGGLLVLRAARSLGGRGLPWWVVAVPLAVTWATAVVEGPGSETWAGGGFYLAAMGATVGVAAAETWRLRLGGSATPSEHGALLTFAVAGSLYAAFYALRWAIYVTEGPRSDLFTSVAGTGVTTLILIATVTAVTLAVTHLAEAGHRDELRRRATTDDLTGVLGRAELLARADRLLAARAAGRPAAVVVSDLDFFKRVNDTHGHAEGDRALVRFACAWRDELGPAELIGRMGGDEFVALLVDVTPTEAAARADAVTRRFVADQAGAGAQAPTASHGVAPVEDGAAVAALIARADAALYEAKAAGRNTVRVHGQAAEPAA
ncbi:GGDEF domain-containing protein [Demequina sp. SYSU T00192]|uniref:GGDEF domain-containing protein n=1 Tax=Demequina litoralis TaxID=3051660 RepID=A0ABT8G5A9_9MICO|nr:GGDEF domain-containing protein [Demequina sp. SYSU T00192]MDN4474320.1 GGDEF domain-containing protein [Demequina sp. SYSU T00192]